MDYDGFVNYNSDGAVCEIEKKNQTKDLSGPKIDCKEIFAELSSLGKKKRSLISCVVEFLSRVF